MIHMWAFLDLPDRDKIYWKRFDDVPRDKVFAMVKNTAKLEDSQLILFDGELYRYDSGSGKFIRTNWYNLEWESD